MCVCERTNYKTHDRCRSLSTFIAFIYLFFCRGEVAIHTLWVSFQLFRRYLLRRRWRQLFLLPVASSFFFFSLLFATLCLYFVRAKRTKMDNFCIMWNKLMRFWCVCEAKSKWWQQSMVWSVYTTIGKLSKYLSGNVQFYYGVPVHAPTNRFKWNQIRSNTLYTPCNGNRTDTRETTHTYEKKKRESNEQQKMVPNSWVSGHGSKLNVFIISEERIQFHRCVVCILFTNRLSCFVSSAIVCVCALCAVCSCAGHH